MKGRFRFWGLYLGLILSFVLHYFATSQLKIYENHLWELFDSPKATIIMYFEMDCMQSTMWLHFCSCFSYAI